MATTNEARLFHEAFTTQHHEGVDDVTLRRLENALRDLAGDPRKQAKAATAILAPPTAWRWLEFEEWRSRFAAEGRWPYMWSGWAKWETGGFPEGEKGAGRVRLARAELLGHTVTLRFYGLRRAGELKHLRDIGMWGMHRLQVDRLADAPGTECRLCARLQGTHSLSDLDHPERLPPFHPGCRCSITRAK